MLSWKPFFMHAAVMSGLALLVIPSLAVAVPYTIAAPVAIADSGSGIIGTLSPVTVIGAAGGSQVTAGLFTNTTALDILFVELTLSAGSADVDQFGIAGVGVLPVGMAYYAASGTQNPNGIPVMEFPATVALFSFDHNGTSAGNLEAGESTGILAVAYNLGDLPPPGLNGGALLASTASFTLSSGANFSVNALVVPVPEPGTALLMGLGLAGFAGMKRVRR